MSSQVGCTLTCAFCHTGTQRLVRNLTAAEIAAQLVVARDRLGDWPGGVRPTGGSRPVEGRHSIREADDLADAARTPMSSGAPPGLVRTSWEGDRAARPTKTPSPCIVDGEGASRCG